MSGPESDPIIQKMYAAIEQGDMAAFKTCFTPDARVWHNDDETDQDIETVCKGLMYLHTVSTNIDYKERRLASMGNLHFVQHVLTADLKSGDKLHLPAMMRIETDDSGLIVRLEEYYDSRATDCLK